MKPLGAGSEIDAYCTKCRMDLGHRIVAMVGGKPKRVLCMTCNSEHAYHAPKAGSKGAVSKIRTSAAPKSRPRPVNNASEWEKRIAGQVATAFSRFSIQRTYRQGDLLLHTKFGEGYVVDVLEDGKVSVMFRDGPRTLAHGQR
ncbi:hypothetical protein ACFL5O_00625 [Myxococcota bacterium]